MITCKGSDFNHLSEVLGLAIRVLSRYEKEKKKLKPIEMNLLEQLDTIKMRFKDMDCPIVSYPEKEAEPFKECPVFQKNLTPGNLSDANGTPKTPPVENKKGISTIKTMLASSKLMKEIMLRDEESRNLVEFAAHCTKATSKGRSELSMVIVDGIRSLFDDLNAKGEDINVSDVNSRKIRIFLHRKSYDVLEDPIHKEIIKFKKLAFSTSARNMRRRSSCTTKEYAGVLEGGNKKYDMSSTYSFLTPNDPEPSLNPLYDNAVQRCFESSQPTECVEENSRFFPLVYEGHICLGVIVIAGFENGIFKLPKFANTLSAIQSIVTLSTASVNHIEDIEWQKSKSDGMLKMAQQLSSDNFANEELLSQSIIRVAMDLCD
eukprot:Tbor_TRINITY_DN6222_c4_g1::TRINITY_DN6222_c4_g1_i6::g.1923::m.1923